MNREEALEVILNSCGNDYWKYSILNECVCIIKDEFESMEQNHEIVLTTLETATEEITELKQVLDIIKDKGVNIFILNVSSSIEIYNNALPNKMKLTQYEYELLKRWLGNDLD